MKATTKRRLLGLGLAVTASLFLASCSALTPGASGGSGSSSTVSTSVPKGKVTLTAYITAPQPAFTASVKAYEKLHPNVTIKAQTIDYATYIQNIKFRLSSGNVPDLVEYTSGNMASLASTYLVNLDPYSKAYGWDQTIPKSALGENTQNDAGTIFYSGHLRALPVGMSLVGVFYNKSLAKEAGIDSAPSTLKEFEDDLAKAKAAGQQPLSVGALDNGMHSWMVFNDVLSPQAGYQAWESGDPKATLVTAGGVESAKLFQGFGDKGYISSAASGTSTADAEAAFAAGKATFMVDGNWAIDGFAKSLGSKLGYFVAPPASAGGQLKATSGNVGYAITQASKHKTVAANFLNFMVSNQGTKIWTGPDGNWEPANPNVKLGLTGIRATVGAQFQKVAKDNGLEQYPDGAGATGIFAVQVSGIQDLLAHRITPQQFIQQQEDFVKKYQKDRG